LKNKLTIEAYGVFVQAYGGMPHAPLARGHVRWSDRRPFIILG